jgi:4-hydroxy-3-polyprenylbenzoate decarboxylase
MLRANEAGAVIMPVIPAFYFAPHAIDDLVEQFVCRVLAQLGLPQEQQYRWQGQSKTRAKDA